MARLVRRKFRRVLIDIDTQVDLVSGESRDRSQLLRHFRRLMAWARVNNIPVISTTIAHRPTNFDGERGPYCIEGTDGQRKIRYTTLADRIVFGPENRLDLPRHLLNNHQQIIFEKRSADPFAHARADRLLTDIRCDEFVVFGMSLETSIQPTVLGLLQRNKKVLLVTDAVAMGRGRDTVIALRKLEAKGAKLVQTEDVPEVVRGLDQQLVRSAMPAKAHLACSLCCLSVSLLREIPYALVAHGQSSWHSSSPNADPCRRRKPESRSQHGPHGRKRTPGVADRILRDPEQIDCRVAGVAHVP